MTDEERLALREQLVAERRAVERRIQDIDDFFKAQRIRRLAEIAARHEERDRRRREIAEANRNPVPFNERAERDDGGTAA